MKPIRRNTLFVLGVSSALALGACSKQAPPPAVTAPPPPHPATPAPPPPPPAAPVAATSVTTVQFANAVGTDGAITTPATSFAPKDTIYAVVTTHSTGTATVTEAVKWTYGDNHMLVNQSSQPITATGDLKTTFHISKPDGFPAGKYTLEVSLDGKLANTSSFEVK